MCYASVCNLNFLLSDVYIIITQLDNTTTGCGREAQTCKPCLTIFKMEAHHMEKLL